jgi:hypothetical protein
MNSDLGGTIAGIMWKRLLFFLLLNIVVVGAIVLVTTKYQPADDQGTFQGKDEAQLAQPSPAEHPNAEKEKKKSGKKSPWWYEFVTWPGGITTWAILLTLEAIGGQSYETYRSAKAAARGIEIQEKGQRAWLVIRSAMKGYEPSAADHQLRFWWTIENRGRLTARILETQCRYELVEDDPTCDLPHSPNYPTPIRLDGLLIPPEGIQEYFAGLQRTDGRIVVPPLPIGDLGRILEEGTLHLRVYGYVKYIDGLEKERESRFIEYYAVSVDGRTRGAGFRALLGVPADYTKCT